MTGGVNSTAFIYLNDRKCEQVDAFILINLFTDEELQTKIKAIIRTFFIVLSYSLA